MSSYLSTLQLHSESERKLVPSGASINNKIVRAAPLLGLSDALLLRVFKQGPTVFKQGPTVYSHGPRYCLSIRQITKVLVFIYKSHFIAFTQRFCESCDENDQISTGGCTKRFPKIGRCGKNKILRCNLSVHMNKKLTFPQIWNYWITSTKSWHWQDLNR